VRWLVSIVGLACSMPREPEAPPKTPVMAKSSKATPSAGARGPDALTVSAWGEDPVPACEGCDGCEAARVTASSTRQATDDERFEAANLLDGNPSSAWCGPVGSTLTFVVPGGCRVHGLRVLSGHMGDPGRLEGNGRAAELSLSAGRLRGDAEIDDPVGLRLNRKQLVERPPTLYAGWTAYLVEELAVTVRQVHRGSAHEGVCLSELVPVLSGAPSPD